MKKFIYPQELDEVDYREMHDGQIRVYKNGRIFRTNKWGETIEAPQHGIGRGGQYKVISIMLKGKQKFLYVHRLVAEAFIPNELNKPQVNHIDGNPANNNVENLEWATSAENIQHAYDLGLRTTVENNGEPCKLCRKNLVLRTDICSECQRNMEALKQRLKSIRAIKEEFADIEVENLPEKEKLIVKMRMRGCTLEEIGKRFDFTRERARQILNYVKDGRYEEQSENTKEVNVTETPFKLTVKAARVNNGISQGYAAEHFGITRTTLCNWESGKNSIPKDKFEQMINLYGIPMEYLNVEFESGWYRAKSNVN